MAAAAAATTDRRALLVRGGHQLYIGAPVVTPAASKLSPGGAAAHHCSGARHLSRSPAHCPARRELCCVVRAGWVPPALLRRVSVRVFVLHPAPEGPCAAHSQA
eukprot:scaffold6195_cov428-Prasinococcus_capsulatus_cf.AAC.7